MLTDVLSPPDWQLVSDTQITGSVLSATPVITDTQNDSDPLSLTKEDGSLYFSDPGLYDTSQTPAPYIGTQTTHMLDPNIFGTPTVNVAGDWVQFDFDSPLTVGEIAMKTEFAPLDNTIQEVTFALRKSDTDEWLKMRKITYAVNRYLLLWNSVANNPTI